MASEYQGLAKLVTRESPPINPDRDTTSSAHKLEICN